MDVPLEAEVQKRAGIRTIDDGIIRRPAAECL